MGSRNPERDRKFGSDIDLLADYLRDHALLATCTGNNCLHSRKLNVEQMMRWLGPRATIGELRKKLRCSRCDTRVPTITATWVGKRGDGR
jgi:hypothetical protein